MAGGKWAQKIQVGWESTAGTEVNATQIWCGVGGMLQDNRTKVNPATMTGFAVPIERQYETQTQGAWAQASTEALFEQLDYVLSAAIKDQDTGTADGAASSGYLRTYPAAGTSYTALNTLQYMTIEGGDDNQAWVGTYGFVTDFTLEQRQGEAVMVTSNWVMRDVATSTFTGSLTLPTVEAIARPSSLYIDNSGGTPGTTQVSNVIYNWRFECTTGWVPSVPRDDNLYFDKSVYSLDAWDATLTVLMAHDSTIDGEVDKWIAGTDRLVTVKVLGSAYGTAGSGTKFSGKKGLQIDCAGKWESFGPISDDGGESVVEGVFKPRYVSGDAIAYTIYLANEDATTSS